jgi:two-component system OmpR family response regulator
VNTSTRPRRPKILIVDDSEVVCESVSMILEPRGFDVVMLTSLFTFVQTLSTEKPDLALVDVSMPALSGDKLIEIANKHRESRCPMVLFSDRAVEELARLVKTCGAAGYIKKTGNADTLVREVQGYLTRGR